MVELNTSKFGSIEKLSSDNYNTWKLRISAIMSAMLALKIVTGEETEEDLPIGNSPANITKRESYKKRQALATIATLLSCTHETGFRAVPTYARHDAEVAGGYGYYRVCISSSPRCRAEQTGQEGQ